MQQTDLTLRSAAPHQDFRGSNVFVIRMSPREPAEGRAYSLGRGPVTRTLAVVAN